MPSCRYASNSSLSIAIRELNMKHFGLSPLTIVCLSTLSLVACNQVGFGGKTKKSNGSAPAAAVTPAEAKPDASPSETGLPGDGNAAGSTGTPDAISSNGANPTPPPAAPVVTAEGVCDAPGTRKFVTDVFQIPEKTNALPNFSTLKVLQSICYEQLNFNSLAKDVGFPAVSFKEWFAFNIKVKVEIATAGEYKFALTSDDGSMLLIDGADAKANGGVKKPGKVNMTKGVHDLNIQYYQASGNLALDLKWQAPGETKFSYMPLNILRKP